MLDIQSDLLASLPTRLVAPLIRVSAFGIPLERLHPRFVVEQTPLIMVTTEIGVLPPRVLGAAIISLAEHRQEIVGAIDMLITGV